MSDSCTEAPGPLETGELRPWLDVDRSDAAPFVHRFEASGGKYVYDVNTRRIIRVLPVVWDVLADLGRLGEDRLVAKHAPVHGGKEVAAALDEVGRAQKEKGVFLSFRPATVRPPGRESVRRKLDRRREQLILNVTEDCNFRCSYCVFGGAYPGFPARSGKVMGWEVARSAIDEFLSHSLEAKNRAISFYGGEPLLNLSLIRRCVSYVKERQDGREVTFATTTNGSLLAGEAAEFLAAERFSIVVSLDGPAEIHDRHRRTASGGPSWATVTGNVRTFLAAHPEYRTNGRMRFNAVATRTTDLRQAEEYWGSCEDFADSMGLDVGEVKRPPDREADVLPGDAMAVSSHVLYEELVAGLKAGRLAEEHKQKRRWVQTALFQRSLAVFHRRKFLTPHLPEKMVFLAGCIPGARRTFVSTAGRYFACERVAPCDEQAIGSVQEGVSLDKVMALLEAWSSANGDQCRYCWCLSHCSMGCLATADEGGRITDQAKSNACARYRRHAHGLLQDYVSILEANPGALNYTAGFVFE